MLQKETIQNPCLSRWLWIVLPKQHFQKGDTTMIVTATEFKTNFGKYLDLLSHEDIFITRNGKTIAKVVNPHVSAVDSISGLLAGKVADDIDRKSIREERISKYAIDD
jgi:antitoxin (DNA-binding transcriptional repressor) of toxin-antitoxin stability system